MTRAVRLAGLLFALMLQPALAQNALVSAAVDAEGGAAALKALTALAIKADARHWEPEQSLKAGGEPRFLGDSKLTITWDLAHGAARTTWERTMKYPYPRSYAYTEVVTPTQGYVDADGRATPMSGLRVAAHVRELARAAPTLLEKAAADPQAVAAVAAQTLGGQSYEAVAYTDGGARFIIMFDKSSRLPAAIRTLDDDNVAGDSTYDLVLGDWKAVAGVKMAHTLSYRLNDVEVAHVAYTEVTANPTIAPDAFALPAAFKVAEAAAKADVPYQWVIRRLALGLYVDSDEMVTPPGGSLKVVDLAPDVSQVVGGSHNNLIVAMQDGIVVFDAPIAERQSRFVIAAIKARYPGKPIKYVVLTHHHMDHTGGTRAYVAEGATVVVPAPTKAHWDAMLNRPRTVAPDAEQQARKPVTVVEVNDTFSIKDASGEVRLHRIDNPHVDGMLIGHVVKPNIVWVTDLYSPVRDKAKNPGAVAFGAALAKLGITGATIAGGHGASGKQSDLDAILASN